MKAEGKLLTARINDILRLSNEKNSPKFSAFLSLDEQSEIMPLVLSGKAYLFGGYEDAERKMFGALPDYVTNPKQAFPITAVRFVYPKEYTLSHRDVLGSLMALGIKREGVGDICFSEGVATVFVTNELSDYILTQITKIGRVGVKAKALLPEDDAQTFDAPATKDITFTVSSPRIDAILGALTGCSRTKADQLIKDGLVFVNSVVVTKPTKQIAANDKITVRGTGKFIITGSGNYSKKGREIITAKKYL